MKIFLEKYKTKTSNPTGNETSIDIENNTAQIPISSVDAVLNQYEQYLKEKDASDVHRLVATINPVCSNILFNQCTEIVFKEGSDECKYIGKEGVTVSEMGDNMLLYHGKRGETLTRSMAIKDTGYSHSDIGPLVYHCGTDIFNNHTLRAKNRAMVCKCSNGDVDFNTISDKMRNSSGEVIEEAILKMGDKRLSDVKHERHLYCNDDIRPFQKTINEELIESNGWVGFINPTSMKIDNYKNIAINKCMNNNKQGEQIDMYPDRSLYSFTPKYNKYRRRIEKNWDICLTYPYSNDENCYLIKSNNGNRVNGILCEILPEMNFKGTIFDNPYEENSDDVMPKRNSGNVYLRTKIRNSLQAGDYIKISVVDTSTSLENIFDDAVMIQSIGYMDQDTYHIFSLTMEDLFNAFNFGGNNISFLDSDGKMKQKFEIRIQKMVDGMPSRYYLRKFKKIPKKVFYRKDKEEKEDKNTVFAEGYAAAQKIPYTISQDVEDGDKMHNITVTIPDSVRYLTVDEDNVFHTSGSGLTIVVDLQIFGDGTQWIVSPDKQTGTIGSVGKLMLNGEDSGESWASGEASYSVVGDYKAHHLPIVIEDGFKFGDDLKYRFTSKVTVRNFGHEVEANMIFTLTANRGDEPIDPDYPEPTDPDNPEDIVVMEGEIGGNLNKLAFSENIYSDNISQIVFTDDIITSNLRDNMGRKVSEIFLTIIKRNAGRDMWYEKKQYADPKVEFSHCFGKITSGFDINGGDLCIHQQHNVPTGVRNVIPSSSSLESDITIDEDEFYGDIVEYMPNRVEEMVLENVYHRFNTEQRESTSNEFGDLEYQNIVADDFDLNAEFEVENRIFRTEIIRANICPEGYYYQPHYRIPLRKFADTINQGQDMLMALKIDTYNPKDGICGATTAKNYYLNVGDVIIGCNKNDRTAVRGVVTAVSNDIYTKIKFEIKIPKKEDIKNYLFFKSNPLKPAYAVELNDGTGRYLWRDIADEISLTPNDELYDSIFTNGAHYHHKMINFYLRRQDPTGEYGLNTDGTMDYITGASQGEIRDISMVENIVEEGKEIC